MHPFIVEELGKQRRQELLDDAEQRRRLRAPTTVTRDRRRQRTGLILCRISHLGRTSRCGLQVTRTPALAP
jgi:hypothetical protein